MDIAKTTPQRKFRQITHPHEHNFSVPSFGCDFRPANKAKYAEIRQQSAPRTISECKQSEKAIITSVGQSKPSGSTVTKMGPSVDQTTDFTYSSRPQLRDTQMKCSQAIVSVIRRYLSGNKKLSRSRPGSMYLPKSNNDVCLSEQNMNPERSRLLQLSQSNSSHANQAHHVSTDNQIGHFPLQRGSLLSGNTDKQISSSNSMLPVSAKGGPDKPSAYEKSAENAQIQPPFHHSQKMESQVNYLQCQQLLPSQQSTNQSTQLVQTSYTGGWILPQSLVASSQFQLSASNNQINYNTSSQYNPQNNVSGGISTISAPDTSFGSPLNPMYVIPQNYTIAPGMNSLSNSQNPISMGYLQTQPVHNPQLLSGTTVLQPQVAIVAVDPETLRAILSGTFNTQALFPPANMTSASNQSINVTSSLNLPTQTSCIPNIPPLSLPEATSCYRTAEPPAISVSESTEISFQNKQVSEDNKYTNTPSSLNESNTLSSQPSYIKSTTTPATDSELFNHSSDRSTILKPSNTVSQASLPKLRNPPRTLRFLEKSEPYESSGHTDDCQRGGQPVGREPRKLNASSFILRSQKASTVEPQNVQEGDLCEDSGSLKGGDSDTPGQRQDVSSISAYYEQMKRRNRRPLSAYRPTGGTQPQSTSSPSLLKTECLASFDSKPMNRRSTHQLTRGYTIASSKPDHPRSSNFSEEKVQPQETDPSIMSVAERARQWQLAQSSGQNNARYSTSGFIDQDLVDCQDLVPVEDRVKMFDTGAPPSCQGEKNPRLTSELQGLRERRQVKFTDTNLVTSLSPSKSSNLANKSVTSVTLQTKRLNHVNPRRPHSSVNLQRIKQDLQQTGIFQPTVNRTAPNLQYNNNNNNHTNNINLKIAPVKGVQQPNGDELSKLSLNEKRNLFNQRDQQGQYSLTNKTLNISTEPVKRVIRRKTQPITLDDLARANQLILERYYGKHLESPFGSVKGDEQDSFGFHEYDSQISTPEASLLRIFL
ncbi:unnamed protein product [Heterobilharzia americana]|nr:unnamed protein product [Heterobilharzia americana]